MHYKGQSILLSKTSDMDVKMKVFNEIPTSDMYLKYQFNLMETKYKRVINVLSISQVRSLWYYVVKSLRRAIFNRLQKSDFNMFLNKWAFSFQFIQKLLIFWMRNICFIPLIYCI